MKELTEIYAESIIKSIDVTLNGYDIQESPIVTIEECDIDEGTIIFDECFGKGPLKPRQRLFKGLPNSEPSVSALKEIQQIFEDAIIAIDNMTAEFEVIS